MTSQVREKSPSPNVLLFRLDEIGKQNINVKRKQSQ